MILNANRDNEIIFRARHRTVLAHIYLQTPEFRETFPQAHFHAAAAMPCKEGEVVLFSSHIMSPDKAVVESNDVCEPAIEKDIALQRSIQEKVRARNVALLSGNLSAEEQKFLYDCSDLTDEATGLPKGFVVLFNESSAMQDQIEAIPFTSLRRKLGAIQSALEKRNGRLQAVEVAHTCAVSAYDYNKIPQKLYVGGFRPSYGEIILRTADRLLGDIGIPRIIKNDPTPN